MSMTVEELIAIRDLPAFLRTEHCYNDLQHAMLVVLFRHGLTALKAGQGHFAGTIIDNISLYLYIHFLNEEEGLAYKTTTGLMTRDKLAEHSELHVDFLDYWRDRILVPYKKSEMTASKAIDELSKYYNLIIKHIDGEDVPTYGADAVPEEHTRTELARVALSNMPMSPFMSGAFQTVHILDRDVAGMLDRKRISPKALEPMGRLNMVPHVGRILSGTVGSLRDRFTAATRGDVHQATNADNLAATSFMRISGFAGMGVPAQFSAA